MRKALATAAVVATAATSAAACSVPGTSEPAEEGVAQLDLAFSHPTLFTTGLPYYVATEKGFYDDAGLSVDATVTGGGSETVQAVVSGSADIGLETGAATAIGAYVSGAPIRIIAASTTGLDLLWFADADGGISEPTDLAGQKVGYSTEGSSTHIGVLALSSQLESEGLEPIQAEAIGGVPDQLTAVQTDQIAAGWTTPPFFLDKIADGELVVAAEGADIGDYKDVAIRVIIGHVPWLEENPEAARAFLEVQAQAWDWIFENPEEAVKIWKEAADLELPEDVLLKTFDYYDRENVRIAPLDGRDVILEDALKFGFTKEPLSEEQANELFDLSYLPEG